MTEVVESSEQERDRLLRLATLSEILPSLMHLVRNPLAAALASLEVIIEDLPPGDLRDDLSDVLAEVQRASSSLRGVGDVTRDLRSIRRHYLATALAEGIAPLKTLAEASHVTLRLDCRTLDPLPFEPSVIRAIVFHLVSNAIAASRPEGQVLVRSSLHDDTRTRTFELEVVDDGGGMSGEQLARCRDLFFTTKHQGSGLGLPLCNQTVVTAGGKMAIASTQGRGTRVTLRVPVLEAASDGGER